MIQVVVLRQVEMPFYRGIGRHRGKRLGALAQNIGRAAKLFLGKHVVVLAKRVRNDLFEFAAPKVSEFVAVKKN